MTGAVHDPNLASTPGEAALAYAELGWSVVPMHTPVEGACSCGRGECGSPGKHPRIRWEAAAHEAAGAATVAAWWDRWPDANVGVVCGKVSGVAVVDVDPRNGGEDTLDLVEHLRGAFPETAVVRTGGGGWHHWFSVVAEEIPSGILGPGLEVKGEGGVVVAPPSVHVSGHRYRWLASPWAVAPAPAPEWLAGALRGDRATTPAGRSPSPPRTQSEQEAFADAWARAGIDVLPGDRYYRCPFHHDEHPSLHVDLEGCRWYCFGCRRGGGMAALADELGMERPAPSRSRQRGRVGPRLPISLSGDRSVDVVGESHHQAALLDLAGGVRHYGGVELEAVADLVPEPENRYDRNAVAVKIGGLVVGHLSREDAVDYRALVDERIALDGAATCPARIVGGWDRGQGDVGLFGVELCLPSPD